MVGRVLNSVVSPDATRWVRCVAVGDQSSARPHELGRQNRTGLGLWVPEPVVRGVLFGFGVGGVQWRV